MKDSHSDSRVWKSPCTSMYFNGLRVCYLDGLVWANCAFYCLQENTQP